MAANSPAAPKTVGHLIQRLEMFERDLEVVAVNALTGTSDSFGWILAAALLPPDNEKVAILYLPRNEAEATGSTRVVEDGLHR
jgi:hypothetical protein